jgi:hypothetical protein
MSNERRSLANQTGSRVQIARWLAGIVVLVGGWIGSTSALAVEQAPASQQQATDEYRVKAAFLYNFARYVKWPEPVFKDKDAPLRIAVVGSDVFSKVLEDLLKDKKAGTRPVLTSNFATAQELGECQILYVPSSEEKNLPQIKLAYKDRSILIVGDSYAVAEQGTQIGFYLDKSKVRFAINTDAVRAAKLEVSSELLKLAKVIEEPK